MNITDNNTRQCHGNGQSEIKCIDTPTPRLQSKVPPKSPTARQIAGQAGRPEAKASKWSMAGSAPPWKREQSRACRMAAAPPSFPTARGYAKTETGVRGLALATF